MSTENLTPPPAHPSWDAPLDELADYLDAVDRYVDRICTPDELRRRCREAVEAAGYTWEDTQWPT